MIDIKARSAECRMPSDRSEAEKSAMRLRAYEDYGIVVLDLNRMSLENRAKAESMFLEQQRDDKFAVLAGNIVRIR